jgi:hypothetical protein
LEDSFLDCGSVAWILLRKYSELEADKLTAGASIGVGLIRICFPESKQFLEAKKAGKKAGDPGAFWRETKQMLGQEWKMCIYCIILMTWVCPRAVH